MAERSFSTLSTMGCIGSLFMSVSKYFIISNIKLIVGLLDGVPFIPCSKSFSKISGQFETFLGRIVPYVKSEINYWIVVLRKVFFSKLIPRITPNII
jgi:hypothetical protein